MASEVRPIHSEEYCKSASQYLFSLNFILCGQNNKQIFKFNKLINIQNATHIQQNDTLTQHCSVDYSFLAV